MTLLPYLKEKRIEAGCDEAGRGCLAGPVFAAAVILPDGFSNPILNDSKQLTEKQRMTLRTLIETEALAWSVATVSAELVDKINVLNASILAMHLAIEQLSVRPRFLLIDGNKFKPFQKIPYKCIVKGDSLYASIAAASVLAKTHRDAYMKELHTEYPEYGWNKNKGYPTQIHRNAISLHGITKHHRKSFRLTDGQLKLELEF